MPLSSDLLALLTLFNGQKTDLPDGVLHKDCVFRLNGRAYHDTLGRPISDPLVRLVGCGPAGYRFILAALRHAIDEPRASLHEGSAVEHVTADGTRVHARGTLSGTSVARPVRSRRSSACRRAPTPRATSSSSPPRSEMPTWS